MKQETTSLIETVSSDPAGFKSAWLHEFRGSASAANSSATARHDVDRVYDALLKTLQADPDFDRLESPSFDELRSELAEFSQVRAT